MFEKEPEGNLEEEDETLERVKSWFATSRDHSRRWREDAREDFDFVAGNQWDDEAIRILQDQQRPVITFNRIEPIVSAVCGSEVNNRQEVRYIARTEGDEQVNEVLTAGAAYFRDCCDAEDEESDAFADLVICGMGWTDTAVDYEVDPEGEICINRIDPLEMYWDAGSSKHNLSDATYVIRVKDFPRKTARAMFPDADPADLDAVWARGDDGDKPGSQPSGPEAYQHNDRDQKSTKSKNVTIVQCQWYEVESYFKVTNLATGEAIDVSEEEFPQFQQAAMDQGAAIDFNRLKRRVYKEAFLGAKTLKEGPAPSQTAFTMQAMTAKRDRNTGLWYGLVKAMKDPQQWANKWLSQTLHIINSNAKGGLIAEANAFVDVRKAQDEWSSPDSITLMKDGAVSSGRFTFKPPITYPSGLDSLMQFAISSIRDVSGVSVELLGMADREQAGVLEYQRKQSAMTILAPMFNSLRRYRKVQGRVMIDMIQEYVSDGRLVRIVGDQGAKYVRLVRDEAVAKYDVIVDQAPSSPNQKEASWAVISQLLPMLPNLGVGPNIWAEVVKASPLPAGVAEKIVEEITQPKEPQPDPAQMAVEAETQLRMAEMQLKQQESQQKYQIDLANLGLKEREIALKEKVASVEAAGTVANIVLPTLTQGR